MPVAEFTAALSAIKTTTDLLKLGIEARDDAKIKSASIDLTNQLLDVQRLALESNSQQFDLEKKLHVSQERIHELEAKERLIEKYEMVEITSGSFVYRIKEDKRGDEPIHHVCPNCLNDAKKTILQIQRRPTSATIGREKQKLVCTNCPAEFDLPQTAQPSAYYSGGRVIR